MSKHRKFFIRVCSVTLLVAVGFAIRNSTRPDQRELQVAAVNEAIRGEYPPGTNFLTVSTHFKLFYGRPTSDFPQVFHVAHVIDADESRDQWARFRAEHGDVGPPEGWLKAVLDYPNPNNEITFHYLYTRRGDLTGYDAYQDELVLCVKDDVIVDYIQISAYPY